VSLEVKMVKIRIDGKYYEGKAEKNLLETCLSIGIDIPHFCFHPALGSVGACRLCAVKKFRDKDDTKGLIVMSCMEPVTEGLIISVEDPEVKAFRASVLESLMTNHPHDCPVCDEGGECHLQDMTVMTGHNYRRYDFPKRTYNDQALGPFINHEMNRCIQCYRCVRFYRDYAGGKDLNVFASRNHVYFGRHEDGTLENEFSGNLVEVCPTGVFTDKTLKKHFTRKWDLTNAPSVCVHCGVGCNIIASERYGSLRRIMSRYNGAVNGYFICDRGRFGYEFVNNEKRIKSVQLRSGKQDDLQIVEKEQLLSSMDRSGLRGKKIVGIGSPRASLESNFALMSFVGKENFYHGTSGREYLLTKIVSEFYQHSGTLIPSLKQIEKADAIFILGEDLINTAPMIALAVRQATRNVPNEEAKKKGIQLWNDAPVRELAQDTKSPVFIATHFKDSLAEIAAEAYHSSSEDLSKLGIAVASKLDNNTPDAKTGKKDLGALADKIALMLKDAKNPLIISGISSGDETIVHTALNIITSLETVNSNAMLCMVLPECNSMGLSLLPGKSFEDLFIPEDNHEIDTLIVLENDLYRRADEERVNELFRRSNQIVVLDHLDNKTTRKADILLPAATFAESEGTIVNNEGRAQRYYKTLVSKKQVQESWRWIGELIKLKAPDFSDKWIFLDDIAESMANELPLFSKLRNYKPDADFRMLNMKMPRQTIRYSGRTAMNANIAVSEARLPQDPDSPLAFSMEGQNENPPSSMVPFYWFPGWNSVQAMYNYLNEPDGQLKGGDPGVKLFEQSEGNKSNYHEFIKPDHEVQKGELQIVPVHQIFGSEELSAVSPSISERIHEPCVLMNQKDSEILHLSDGEVVILEISNVKLNVKIKIENSFAQGLAGLPASLPGMPYTDIPGYGKFHKL
jgi:NADH-quinone oxidoreductase subunit G